MIDDFPIKGEDAGYVPCLELAAPLDAEEEGAIFGLGTGFVAIDAEAAVESPRPREAIVGSGVGFVAKPCEEECVWDTNVLRSLRMLQSDDAGTPANSSFLFNLFGMWNTCVISDPVDREWRTFFPIADSSDVENFCVNQARIVAGVATGMMGDYASNPGSWIGASVSWELRGGVSDAATTDIPFDMPGYVVLASGTQVESEFIADFPNDDGCTGPLQTSYDEIDITFPIPALTGDEQYWVYLVATSLDSGFLPFEIPPPPAGSIETRAALDHNLTSWVMFTHSNFGDPDPEIDSTVSLCRLACEAFVIVGVSGELASSPGGITWTSQFVPFGGSANNILAAAWSPELSLFVVTGQQGKLATSPDGVTWTLQTSSFGTTAINAVVWIPELARFVAAGGTPCKLATSPDGINWTQRTTGLDASDNIRALAWGSGTLVALGSSPSLDSVAVSGDGVSWTTGSMTNDPLIHGACLAWSPSAGFISGGGFGNVNLSSDGLSWSHIDSGMWTENPLDPPHDPEDPPFTPWGFISADWSPELGIFAMVYNDGGGGGGIATSPNGTSWTLRFDNTGSSPAFNVIVWSTDLELFLVGGEAGNLYQSADGVNWTFRDVVLDAHSVNAIAGPGIS